jgi:hypothetical protein
VRSDTAENKIILSLCLLKNNIFVDLFQIVSIIFSVVIKISNGEYTPTVDT